MPQQKRIDDAIFIIDARLIEMRERINIHRIKTQDDALLRPIEIINISRESNALQPKIYGLLSIHTMCHVQATNHLFEETTKMLRDVSFGISELLKELIIKE